MSKRKWYTKAIYLTVALALTLGLLMIPAEKPVAEADVPDSGTFDITGGSYVLNTDGSMIGTFTGTNNGIEPGPYYVKMGYAITVVGGNYSGNYTGLFEAKAWLTQEVGVDHICFDGVFDDIVLSAPITLTVTTGSLSIGSGGIISLDYTATDGTGGVWTLDKDGLIGIPQLMPSPVSLDVKGEQQKFVIVNAGNCTMHQEFKESMLTCIDTGRDAALCGLDCLEAAQAEDPEVTAWTVIPGLKKSTIGPPGSGMDIIIEGGGGPTYVGGDYTGTGNQNWIKIWTRDPGDCHVGATLLWPYWDGENCTKEEIDIYAEKKWGWIQHTKLDVDHISPGLDGDLGTADDIADWAVNPVTEEQIEANLDHEEWVMPSEYPYQEVVADWVFADFYWGPGEPPPIEKHLVAGAVVHWWLLQEDEAGANQDALKGIINDLGFTWYDDWSAGGIYDPSPAKDPEEWIDWLANWGPDLIKFTADDNIWADDTVWKDPADGTTPNGTKITTVTQDNLPGQTRGLTTAILHAIDEDDVLIVTVVEYPFEYNGENPVCIEFGKKHFGKIVPPKITEVKTPQVRWAGEKIILEKDWSDVLVPGNYVAVYHMDEASIGTLYMGGDNPAIEVDGGDIWVWVDTVNPTSEVILETQFQGKADVEVALYEYGPYPTMDMTALFDSDEPLDSATAQTYVDGWAPLVNTGFMVYYLAFEEIAFAEDISHIDGLTPRVDDAEVAVQVKGWFTCELLGPALDPDTGEVRAEKIVDCDNDGIPDRVLPRGRYVLPVDWANLAGNNYELRPNWDLMDMAHLDAIVSPEDLNNDHVEELGPYDFDVVTTDPPDEADDPCIGPFNTLQPWSVDDMWIADDVVPADFMVAAPLTWPRGPEDVRNTVVPDGLLNWYDCPMPQALVLFDIVAQSEVASLSGLDKGHLEGYGFAGTPTIYQSPFYCVEITSSQWITPLGYNHDSWGVDGPYDFWTDKQIDSIIANTMEIVVDPTDVEVYCDNHGIAGVTINTLSATGHVTIEATAEFPNSLKKGQYPPMTTEIDVPWGEFVEHLNPDFEADPRTGDAPIEVCFDPTWTSGGLPPYVTAEWDFGDDTDPVVIDDEDGILTMEVVCHLYEYAGTYTVSLTITDSSEPSLVHTETKHGYIVLAGEEPPAEFPLCDIDESGSVNLLDFYAFALAFGSTPADDNWNANCDLVESGEVDIADFFVFAVCYDEHSE